MTKTDWEEFGKKARQRGRKRESCRLRKNESRAAWLRGYDTQAASETIAGIAKDLHESLSIELNDAAIAAHPDAAAQELMKAPTVKDVERMTKQIGDATGGACVPTSLGVHPGAKKFDGGKAPLMQGCIQRFPLALEQIARVSDYGRRKYGTYDGWEQLEDARNRYNDAGGRHTVLEASEGSYDVGDSGLPHAAQHAWNALA